MAGITLQDGMNILEAAFDKARSLNLTVAVSVVDARGDLVAAARMDGRHLVVDREQPGQGRLHRRLRGRAQRRVA